MSEHPGSIVLQHLDVVFEDEADKADVKIGMGAIRQIASYVSTLETRLEKAEAERDRWEKHATTGDDVLMRMRGKTRHRPQ